MCQVHFLPYRIFAKLIFEPHMIYIHVYQSTLFFFFAFVGCASLALLPLVDQWNSVKPLAGLTVAPALWPSMCVLVCVHKTKRTGTHSQKKLLLSATSGQKLHSILLIHLTVVVRHVYWHLIQDQVPISHNMTSACHTNQSDYSMKCIVQRNSHFFF